jgi:hypothetical protein
MQIAIEIGFLLWCSQQWGTKPFEWVELNATDDNYLKSIKIFFYRFRKARAASRLACQASVNYEILI